MNEKDNKKLTFKLLLLAWALLLLFFDLLLIYNMKYYALGLGTVLLFIVTSVILSAIILTTIHALLF